MTALVGVVLLLVLVQLVLLLSVAELLRARRERDALRHAPGLRGARPLDDLAASPAWWHRVEAARAAGDVARLGDPGLLRTMLDDPHPAVQSAATSGLAPLVDPTIVGQLLDRLAERPMAVRLQQYALLEASLPVVEPALLQRITADAPPRRLKSWIALAEAIGSPVLFERVATLHGHPDPLIRLSVARALKRHHDPGADEILLIALHDHDWRVRAVAARSIGAHGNAAAVPRLAGGLRDVRWWVRFRCGLALAQIGEPGRVALDEAARDVDRYAGEMATMIAGLSPDSVLELAEG